MTSRKNRQNKAVECVEDTPNAESSALSMTEDPGAPVTSAQSAAHFNKLMAMITSAMDQMEQRDRRWEDKFSTVKRHWRTKLLPLTIASRRLNSTWTDLQNLTTSLHANSQRVKTGTGEIICASSVLLKIRKGTVFHLLPPSCLSKSSERNFYPLPRTSTSLIGCRLPVPAVENRGRSS